MKKRRLEDFFKAGHLGKIVSAVFLAAAAGFIAASVLFLKSRPAPVEGDRDGMSARADKLSEDFEREIVLNRLSDYQGLCDQLRRMPVNPESLIRIWMSERPEVLSVIFLSPAGPVPLRLISDAFWRNPAMSTREVQRSDAIRFLMEPDPGPADSTAFWSFGSHLPDFASGAPLLKFFHRSPRSPLSVGIVFQAPPFKDALAGGLLVGERFELTSGDSILARSAGPMLSGTVSQVGEGPFFTFRRSLTLLPYSLTLHIRPPGGTGLQPDPEPTARPSIWMVLSVLLLLLLILSVFSMIWIERPLRSILSTAMELGRGNYAIRIPEQRDPGMQRLARLINYMVEEMDHLQQINVGQIINEKNKTEAILRNIADGILVTDNENRILVLNGVAERWFGVKESAVLQKPMSDSIRIPALEEMLEAVQKGDAQTTSEFKHWVPEAGQYRIFQSHAARVFNAEKEPIGVIAVLRDITEQREADHMKSELISMVAHELKSPLTSIFGFSELLVSSGVQNPRALDYAGVIFEESRRLNEFVNNFLDLSRLEAGKAELRMMPLQIREMVQKVLESQKAQRLAKQIKIITELPEALPPVLGDHHMIEQALSNLVNNAIKYSPAHSKIGIEAENGPRAVTIRIIDSGIGIPEQELPNIFQKFYRVVHTELDTDVEGSGIGLALVKEIIERHRGTLSVKSTVGVGSIFTVTLPRAEASE
ncbi:PAS domain-containing protein [bacterium]|nr:PAS domain-containing protein [bacterium]